MRRLIALSGLLCLLALMAVRGIAGPAPSVPWRALMLERIEISTGSNVLVRWRPLFPHLFPADPAVAEQLQALSSPLENVPVPDDAALRSWLLAIAPVLPELVLREGELLQLPAMHGPETPFPDHQPLRQLVVVRTAALKMAWRDGRQNDAVRLAIENLMLSRTLLGVQEGLVPLLHSSGVWQLTLDGVYWLARQPDLNPHLAARLQRELFADAGLGSVALIRAFRGEFTFFTKVVVDRFPDTKDLELFLSSIGSLGLAPPHAPPDGEPRLAIPSRAPFDREATLQAAADDVGDWILAFGGSLSPGHLKHPAPPPLFQSPRHPRGLTATHTHRKLERYAREIPELLRYSVQDTPATAGQIARVDAEVANVDNPVGKLFLIITTSQWEPISASLFRREAQRSALTALLAWRRLGRPAGWKDLMTAGLLAEAPPDPFSAGPLSMDLSPPRVWSVGENGINEGGSGDGDNMGRPPDLTWPFPLPLK